MPNPVLKPKDFSAFCTLIQQEFTQPQKQSSLANRF